MFYLLFSLCKLFLTNVSQSLLLCEMHSISQMPQFQPLKLGGHMPRTRGHLHPDSFSFSKEEFEISFPLTRTVPLLETLRRGCLPDHYSLNLLNSSSNRYISYLKRCASSDSFLYAITTISFTNPAIYISSYILYWQSKDKNIKETYIFGEQCSSVF